MPIKGYGGTRGWSRPKTNRIVETPAGEKQLRYFVGLRNSGVDEINALSKRVQAKVLEAFGLAAATKFIKGKAVGSV